MELSLFDSFADMIEAIPARAIIPTLARESLMVEEDLAYQRPVSLKEAASILAFCRWVEAVRKGTLANFSAANVPARHLEFYRQTVKRLVEAEELPFRAQEEFDHARRGDALKMFDYAG